MVEENLLDTGIAGHMAVSAGGVPNVAEQLEGCGQAGSLKRQQPELVAENTTTPKAPKRQKSIPSAEQHDDQNQTPNQDGCQQLQQAVQSVCDEEELPSWCEHPLVLRQHFPDDAQVRAGQAVCLLPSVFQHNKHALLCNSSHSMWRHVWRSRTPAWPLLQSFRWMLFAICPDILFARWRQRAKRHCCAKCWSRVATPTLRTVVGTLVRSEPRSLPSNSLMPARLQALT